MRIFIEFKNQEKIFYQQNQLVGLVYSLVRETPFSFVHNLHQKNPRFFNFSQLFLSNNHLSFIISSPLKTFIESIYQVIKTKKQLRLADCSLPINSIMMFSLKINFPLTIKVETPIIIRIPKERYPDYELENLDFLKNYSYFYWRPKEGVLFDPFIKQLEAGVYKKYKLFSGKVIEEKPIFLKFIYKKTVDLPYFKKGKKISRPGTLWEFEVNKEIFPDLLKFMVDNGLGELNSQGYGFVSIKKLK